MRSVFPQRKESWELLDRTFQDIKKAEEEGGKALESDLKTKMESYHEWLKAQMYEKFPETKPFKMRMQQQREKSPNTIRRERFGNKGQHDIQMRDERDTDRRDQRFARDNRDSRDVRDNRDRDNRDIRDNRGEQRDYRERNFEHPNQSNN